MFDWLKRRVQRDRVPEYAAIRKTPNRGLPQDLAEQEASETFRAKREEIEGSLLKPPQRPLPEIPLFVELLPVDGTGVVTMTMPDGQPCLPVFSSPFRAADYARVHFDGSSGVKYLSSSPLELATMLRDVSKMGIGEFALDRCPRCNIVTVLGIERTITADDLVTYWSIWKASELARLDLYMNYAMEAARAGELDTAREVALETVAHVSFEDPRPHLLLQQIAATLNDRALLRETKSFLEFLKFKS